MDDNSREALGSMEQRLVKEREALEQERAALEAEKQEAQKRGWRDNIYGRMNVSVKTMDRVIIVLCALLLIAVAVGVIIK